VIVLLAGLPLAVWFDLRTVTQVALTRQVTDLNAVLSGVRDFYSTDVVGRVLAAHGSTLVTNDFENHPGAIPIPATFSLELGTVVSQYQNNIGYRFVSDFPFKHRSPRCVPPAIRIKRSTRPSGTASQRGSASSHRSS